MIKVTVEGPSGRLVGRIILRALEAVGVKVKMWYDVTPSEVASLRGKATREAAEVSIVVMRAGSR